MKHGRDSWVRSAWLANQPLRKWRNDVKSWKVKKRFIQTLHIYSFSGDGLGGFSSGFFGCSGWSSFENERQIKQNREINPNGDLTVNHPIIMKRLAIHRCEHSRPINRLRNKINHQSLSLVEANVVGDGRGENHCRGRHQKPVKTRKGLRVLVGDEGDAGHRSEQQAGNYAVDHHGVYQPPNITLE